jgi:hypothetical protein
MSASVLSQTISVRELLEIVLKDKCTTEQDLDSCIELIEAWRPEVKKNQEPISILKSRALTRVPSLMQFKDMLETFTPMPAFGNVMMRDDKIYYFWRVDRTYYCRPNNSQSPSVSLSYDGPTKGFFSHGDWRPFSGNVMLFLHMICEHGVCFTDFILH